MPRPCIQEVPKQIQPRERCQMAGAKALSDQELLAIILRTGTRQKNVLHVAMDVLNHFQTMNALKHASLDQLQEIPGIGPTKAIEIVAAIELGYRIANSHIPKFGTIYSTEEAGKWLLQEMSDLHQEHLMVLFLNTKNQIIQKKTIFMGTVNSSVAHPREIFKEAVKYPTAQILIAHNHPSGDITPSQADLHFTQRLILCGDMMGIQVLDHIIVGETRFLSLRESSHIFDDEEDVC